MMTYDGSDKEFGDIPKSLYKSKINIEGGYSTFKKLNKSLDLEFQESIYRNYQNYKIKFKTI